MSDLDRILHDGFRRLERRTPLPDEDRVTTMLRSVPTNPDVVLLRRVRRSLKTFLWMSFFLFSLLACCALAALAYHANFHT